LLQLKLGIVRRAEKYSTFLSALILCDIVVTFLAINFGALEANPICRALIAVSPFFFVTVKLCLALGVYLLLRGSFFWSIVGLGVYSVLLLWNLGVLGYVVWW